MKILVIPNPSIMADLSNSHREQILAAAGDGCEVVVARTPKQQVHHARDADVVLGVLPREAFLAASRLQWVHAMSTGASACCIPSSGTAMCRWSPTKP